MPISNMTYRESTNGHLKQEKVVRISLNKAIIIVVTAILSSAGVSIWGTLAVANTIPFRVDAIEKDITKIKSEDEKDDTKFVSQQVYSIDIRNLNEKMSTVQRSLDQLVKIHLNNGIK